MSVPLGALFVWRLVVFGSYKSVEKAFLVACLLYLAYPISGLLSHPDWGPALEGVLRPLMPLDVAGIAMIVGVIAPWMQFYLQSSIVEKKIQLSDYNKSRLDVIIGSPVAAAWPRRGLARRHMPIHFRSLQPEDSCSGPLDLVFLSPRPVAEPTRGLSMHQPLEIGRSGSACGDRPNG